MVNRRRRLWIVLAFTGILASWPRASSAQALIPPAQGNRLILVPGIGFFTEESLKAMAINVTGVFLFNPPPPC